MPPSTKEMIMNATQRFSPRAKTLAAAIAWMFAVPVVPAFADSASGVNTTLGNALNPKPVNPTEKAAGAPDPAGMGVRGRGSRSPSGHMYDVPNDDPPLPADANESTTTATVEAGGYRVSGDKNAALYRMYRRLIENGGYLANFSLSHNAPSTNFFVEAVGGNIGRDDQFVGVSVGQYNAWKAKAFYDEITHVFTTTAKPIWNGVGTGNLTLPTSLPPAGGIACTTPACTAFNAPAYGFTNSPIANANSFTPTGLNFAIANRLQAITNAKDPTELSLIRKKGGVDIDWKLSEHLSVFAGLAQESRDGARPFGSVQNGGGGALPMETVEPINYSTFDWRAGVRYADPLTQFNLTAHASYFRNDTKSLVFEVPFATAANANAPLVTRGRFALAPDNDAYNIRAEFARSFPQFWKGRLTATVAAGSSEQNDALLPPTITSGVGVVATGAGQFNGNFNQWNTTAALSRQTSEAKIDTRLVDLKFAVSPTTALNMDLRARLYETDNRTDYFACNPAAAYGNGVQYSANGCTGVWGRLINDSTPVFLNPGTTTSGLIPVTINPATGVLTPNPSANIELRNAPSDYRQTTFGFNLDYRLATFSNVHASLEREETERRNREREKVHEDKLKITYTNRALGNTTLRLSVEGAQRRGSEYNPGVNYFTTTLAFYDPAQVAALGTGANRAIVAGYADRVSTLRKYDVADRDLAAAHARLNVMLLDDLDLSFAAHSKEIKYPNVAFGRNDKQTQNAANMDVNWQPTPQRAIYGSAAYQTGTMNQANITQGAGVDANGRLRVYPAGCVVGYVAPNGLAITPANALQVCGDPANNILFNPNNAWSARSRDIHQTLNLGVKQMFGKSILDVNVGRYLGRTKISYRYSPLNPSVGGTPATATAAAIPATAESLAGVGDGFPDLVTNTTTVSANFTLPITPKIAVRLSLYHELGRIRDWHYQGLEQNLLLANGANYVVNLLDAGPRDYRTTAVGVLFHLKL
jgi:Putative outer membrane beta-barrel porin, MtrB/PioB